MLPDLHIHTQWSGHAQGEIGDMIRQAWLKQCPIVGISEHLPFTMDSPKQITLYWQQVPAFYTQMCQAIELWKVKIEVLFGAECDYIPAMRNDIANFLQECSCWSNPLDYVIGSVHFVDAIQIAGSQAPIVEDRGELVSKYYQLVLESIESGLFDIVAHLDLPKKHNLEKGLNVKKLKLQVLDAAHAHNMAIELNTAGFDKPIKESYPDFETLSKAAYMDIPIIVGSDAHSLDDVARYFDEAAELLYKAGYHEITIFRQREKYSLSLERFYHEIKI